MNRVTSGSLLGNVIALIYILEPNPSLLYYLISLPLFYDLIHIVRRNVYSPVLIFLLGYGMICNFAIIQFYTESKYQLIQYILIVTTSDVLQYVAGKYIGRTQIDWPSPKKTIEGYLIGSLSTIIIICTISTLAYPMVIRVVCNGLIGDVIESICKRSLKIKDTSDMLGEHGGWLDRVDGIFFAVLVEYILLP